jgi:hypothetical protein
LVSRAVDAVLDECLAGFAEEEDELGDIEDELQANGIGEIEGVRRE